MSFPSVLYVEKENGSQTKIVGALAVTRKRVLWSEGAYRDSFGAAFMGGALPNTSPGTSTFSAAQLGVTGATNDAYLTQVPATVAASANIAYSLSDEIGHYPWRTKQYLRWMLQFWDATTVGQAMTISAATVSGSPIITVPDTELLTPGQAITGSGITAGSTILRAVHISEGLPITTTALISQNASASATVAATLTGANCLGWFFEDEVIGWGAEISFPT